MLAAYRLAKAVGVDGVFSRIIVATRGITAVSSSVTTELRVLLLDVMDAACRLWPSIQLAVYVDDVTVDAIASFKQIAAVVATATSYIIDYFQNILLRDISRKSVSGCWWHHAHW